MRIENNVLIGYTGSWAGHMFRQNKISDLESKIKRNPKKAKELKAEIEKIKNSEPEPTAIYVSKKKHKELLKFQKLKYLSGFL